MKNAVAIGVLLLLLIILSVGTGYIGNSIFGFSIWSSILIGLASSVLLFLSLVVLLGVTFRFPDHLPGYENDLEV